MSARPRRRRWTAEQLAQCRTLFEDGMHRDEIGKRFGIAGSTVSVMAWQKKWRRKVRPRSTTRRLVAVETVVAGADAPVEIPVTARERAFNERLQRTIAEYWRAQGREVALHVEDQGCDLLGIRSKSVNGVPVKG